MFVMVNLCTQSVPCGTSPKLWVMTAGAACSRLVLMSGRKNLFAHGAVCCAAGCIDCVGCAGEVGCPAVTTVKLNPVRATARDNLTCRIHVPPEPRLPMLYRRARGECCDERSPSGQPRGLRCGAFAEFATSGAASLTRKHRGVQRVVP